MIDNLYKYLSFESGLKILENNSLWFSKPVKFNDPYDCYNKLIKILLSQKGIEAYVARNYSNLNKNEKIRKIKYYSNNQPELILQIKQGLNEREKNIGVACFSKSYNNILMWSHYSINHTGICIGFKFNYVNKDFFIYPVNYVTEFPNTDYFTLPEISLLDWVLTKSKVWEYEQEVRAVSFNKNGTIEIESKLITDIYLGSKINFENRNLILSIVEKGNLRVNIFEMEMADNRFELIAKPILSYS